MYVKMVGILMVISVSNQNQNVKIVKSNQVCGLKMVIGRDQRTVDDSIRSDYPEIH